MGLDMEVTSKVLFCRIQILVWFDIMLEVGWAAGWWFHPGTRHCRCPSWLCGGKLGAGGAKVRPRVVRMPEYGRRRALPCAPGGVGWGGVGGGKLR